MNKQLRNLLIVLEASALSMLLACSAPQKADYNPLGGPLQLKVLCLDEKTGKLVECPPQTEEEMNCHGNMDEDPSNPKKDL